MSVEKTVYTYNEALEASRIYFNCDPNDPNDNLPAKVFLDKYALQDNSGNLLEKTPDQMHHRIAKEFARIEKKKFKKPLSEDKIFSLINRFEKIIPQGSPMYGIGNIYQTISLSNCFVINSPLDSYGSILQSDEMLAQISKRRGGNGVDIENIRPAGYATNNAARTATGTLPFASRFSNTIREVGQNGRRGALMISQNIHHPESVIPWEDATDGDPYDVEIKDSDGNFQYKISSRYYNPNKPDFATMKYDKTKVTGANISLRLSDEFLTAVENKTSYQQRWPVSDKENPKFSQTKDASAVWDKIIYSAWRTAEPGILFWDNIIRESVADCYADYGFKTVSTNPCVTADTWVMTERGARQVSDLIGEYTSVISNGIAYPTKSPGFFSTGIKPILKLEFKRGQSLRLTAEHLVKTPNSWKKAGDLLIGDTVCLSNHRSIEGGWDGEGTFQNGYLVGSLLGDGTFTEGGAQLSFWGKDKIQMLAIAKEYINNTEIIHRSDCGSSSGQSATSLSRDRADMNSSGLAVFSEEIGVSKDKKIKNIIEKTSSEFYKGFLSGWFDADGTVGKDLEKGSFSVRLSSSTLSNLEIAQRMLSRLGIVTTIYKNRREAGFRKLPNKKGEQTEYWCKSQHELHIGKDNILVFADTVGFKDPSKYKKLESVIKNYSKGPYKENYLDVVESMSPDGEEEVYDCSVAGVHEFDANGIRVHNCGEIPLSAYDSCRLLVLNLFGFVKNPFTKDAYFDYAEFYEIAQIAQRLMDDLVDLEEECILKIIAKVKSDPEPYSIKIREIELWDNILLACRNGRRTGTGVTALGDTIAAINVGYGTEEGIAITERIYKTLKFAAYRASVDMAKELGAFPVWNHELEKDNPFLNRIKDEVILLRDQKNERDYIDAVNGLQIWNDMKKYGRRNIALLTTAPVGSASLLTKIINNFGSSSGIEPEFDISPYMRKKKGNPGDKNFRVDSTDQNGDHWMHFNVVPAAVKDWMIVTGEKDIKASPWYNHCAVDLDWVLRVKLQSAAQRHVDHSISSTVNLPSDVSVDKVKEIYVAAWKSGCKGITVYRDGCRTGVLIKSNQGVINTLQKTHAPKRPKELKCDVHHIKVKGQEYFVLVGLYAEDQPYEIFAGKNGMISKSVKKGTLTKLSRGKYTAKFDDNSEISSVAEYINNEEEAITRMASMGLRHGADIQYVVHQLEKVKGDLTSFSKAMARALKHYINNGEVVSGEACKNCGLETIIRQEGCLTCKSCGWTKCG